jgi:hypothetical protein
VLAGTVLVALGVLFLLDALDVLSAGEVIGNWWPIVIVAIGFVRLVGRPPDPLGGGITTAIGLVLLGVTLDVIEGSVLTLVWPLGLMALGAYLVFSRSRVRPQPQDVDSVSAVVLFSGRELAPTSQAFTGGSLVAFFGGFELDLRGCHLAEDAHLDVTTVFGGCDIQVPPGWRIDVRGPAIFGGVENGARGQSLPPDAPTLSLRVLAVFGGVEVKVTPAPVAPTA